MSFDMSNLTSTLIIGGIVLALTSLCLFSRSLPISKTDPLPLPGKVQFVDTHLGKVAVRVIGDKGKPVICLPGVNPALVDEWVLAAHAMSKRGFQVFIVNFHSNPNTKPAVLYGDISSADVNKIIIALMDTVIQTESIVLMGKSWGGGKAMQFVENYPQKVSRMCLIAPASSDPDMIKAVKNSKTPVLLAWAKDDSALWFSNTERWQALLGDQLKLVTAEKGGHRILPDYTAEIIDFIEQ